MHIVAIGGGEIRNGETLAIDRFIVELTGKRSPRALFIPTASGDAPGYCDTFDAVYGRKLGCRTEHLLLLKRDREEDRIRDKILDADLIYVGGGNTLRMMKLWRRRGVDRFLEQAGKSGTVLSGISAGAICWHQWGHSDSRAFSGAKNWSHIRVRGLGFIPATFCPHLDAEKRHASFLRMIRQQGGPGIACDNAAGIWYAPGANPVVKCAATKATARIYRRQCGKVTVTIHRSGETLPLDGADGFAYPLPPVTHEIV